MIKGKKWWWLLAYSVLINAATQPIALAVFQNTEISWWFLETCVTLIEGVLLALLLEIRFPKALQISLVANVVSAVLGLVIFSNVF
jgi:hypothetical protein